MAVKNGMQKIYAVPFESICKVLKDKDFLQSMDVEFIEEAIKPEGTEFRYKRKTSMSRYGRNYFILVTKQDAAQTHVTVTTQSRKVTVLFDTAWKREVERTFGFIDMFLRR